MDRVPARYVSTYDRYTGTYTGTGTQVAHSVEADPEPHAEENGQSSRFGFTSKHRACTWTKKMRGDEGIFRSGTFERIRVKTKLKKSTRNPNRNPNLY